jgi:hypothetical protein
MTVSETAIQKAYELAEIDAFYVERPYSKETVENRLNLLDWFRGWFDKNEEGDIYWDSGRNWLCEEIEAYYNDKIFDLKYSNVAKTPLVVKWIKILSLPRFNLPQSAYHEVAEDLEKIELDNIEAGKDTVSSKLIEYFENNYPNY